MNRQQKTTRHILPHKPNDTRRRRRRRSIGLFFFVRGIPIYRNLIQGGVQ